MEKGLIKTFTEQYDIPEEGKLFFRQMDRFHELMMMYNCAIREVRTKFEVLSDDLSVHNGRNPIEFIKSRIKTPESLYEKLNRRNLEVSIDSIMENINDVAGIRIICSFVDDIYKVAKMLARQDDITVISIKDYIKNPKPNGYRSYHMIVSVPVFFSDKTRQIKVEVQLRTIAMDFWASLEHQMKYKKDVPDAEEIVQMLSECADVIAGTDLKMQEIRNKIMDD